MVLNLLENQGIHGVVHGEYLPGAMGELPANNMVRVMVDEQDYSTAGKIIKDWESSQVEREPVSSPQRSYTTEGFLLGLAIGAGVTIWAYNSPVSTSGIDLDDDGKLDEKWTYTDNRISRSESDRNFDGKIDLVNTYDYRGIITTGESDDNFDGIFETSIHYINPFSYTSDVDTNQNGTIDYRWTYSPGRIEQALLIGEGADTRSKKQYYALGKLIAAEFDSDGDGIYDLRYEYDEFEEIKSRSAINR